jgi:hypothetical protein
MRDKASAGGAAAAGGIDYQNRVAAWAAVHILAEKDATPPWNLPVETTLEWLQCETKQPTDDLLIGTSVGGSVFAQIKRTLQLSKGATSDFASVLDQFVRQFIACRSKPMGTQPLDRPLDPKKDRLVLITSPTSSEPIRFRLNEVLNRVRDLSQCQLADDVIRNDKDHKVLSVVKAHVARSWKNISGKRPF